MGHVSAPRKHDDLAFHGRDAFPSCFRYISFITFPFFLISVTFPVTYFFPFLTHVRDRLINVSEVLPLRTIKVNEGKFSLEIGPLNVYYSRALHHMLRL